MLLLFVKKFPSRFSLFFDTKQTPGKGNARKSARSFWSNWVDKRVGGRLDSSQLREVS